MANEQPIILAEAIDLKIADTVFDAIRIPETKEYRMSQSQILEPIGEDKTWFSRLTRRYPKELRSLQGKGLTMLTQKVKYEKNGTKTQATTWSLSDVRIIWRHFDRKGNEKAQRLIDLLTEDSLQDRFEQVWGERRTVEERSTWDKERLEGIELRLTLTDAIAIYKENHADELSENSKNWLFSNTTDAINLGIFERRAHQLRVDLSVPKSASLRDHMTWKELRFVSNAEDLAARLIVNEDMHPVAAAKEALRRLIIPPQKRSVQPQKVTE